MSSQLRLDALSFCHFRLFSTASLSNGHLTFARTAINLLQSSVNSLILWQCHDRRNYKANSHSQPQTDAKCKSLRFQEEGILLQWLRHFCFLWDELRLEPKWMDLPKEGTLLRSIQLHWFCPWKMKLVCGWVLHMALCINDTSLFR